MSKEKVDTDLYLGAQDKGQNKITCMVIFLCSWE